MISLEKFLPLLVIRWSFRFHICPSLRHCVNAPTAFFLSSPLFLTGEVLFSLVHRFRSRFAPKVIERERDFDLLYALDLRTLKCVECEGEIFHGYLISYFSLAVSFEPDRELSSRLNSIMSRRCKIMELPQIWICDDKKYLFSLPNIIAVLLL